MKKKTVFTVSIIAALALLLLTGLYKCPFKYVLGLSCPMCGMTRAVLCALQLKFKEAFYYHLFWPFVIIYFIIFLLYNLKILKINKKYFFISLYIICSLNLIYYFYRLFNGSDIVYFDFTESLLYKILNL